MVRRSGSASLTSASNDCEPCSADRLVSRMRLLLPTDLVLFAVGLIEAVADAP